MLKMTNKRILIFVSIPTFLYNFTLSDIVGGLQDPDQGEALFDPFGVKIERFYFLTFPNYTNRPF